MRNTVNEPKLQKHFVAIWLLLKNHVEGISGFDIVAGDFMDISNLRVNIGSGQWFWGSGENILKALLVSQDKRHLTAIDCANFFCCL